MQYPLLLLTLLYCTFLQSAELTRTKVENDEEDRPLEIQDLPLEIQDKIRLDVLEYLLRTPSDVHLWRTIMPPISYDCKGPTTDVRLVCMSQDGSKAATSSDGTITVLIWNLNKEPTLVASLSGHTQQISALYMTPDASLLISGSEDATLRLWNLRRHWEPRSLLDPRDPASDSRLLKQPDNAHSKRISALYLTHDCLSALSGSDDGTVVFWNFTDQDDIDAYVIIKADCPIAYVCLASLRTRLYAIIKCTHAGRGRKQALFLYVDISDPKRPNRNISPEICDQLKRQSASISFSDNWDLVEEPTYKITLLGGNNLEIPDILELVGHTQQISSLDISRDDRWLITGSSDTATIVWDLQSKQEYLKYILRKYNNRVLSVAIGGNGRKALVGTAATAEGGIPTLILWDLAPYYSPMYLKDFIEIYAETLALAARRNQTSASAAIEEPSSASAASGEQTLK